MEQSRVRYMEIQYSIPTLSVGKKHFIRKCQIARYTLILAPLIGGAELCPPLIESMKVFL